MISPFEISIRPIQDDHDVARGAAFASLNLEDYDPESHLQWVSEKYIPRLLNGSALGLLVYYESRLVVGDSLLYVFPGENRAELKHYRVADLYADQGIGGFLWRQSEVAATRALNLAPGQTATLTLDTHETNRPARRFFRSRGCHEVGRAALYEPDAMDVLYEKTIQAPRMMP
jgi:ribosomal protein S18 acetylase RimI-like enzyme